MENQRLDTWLDIACLFKTRSQAKSACDAGKVDVNGRRAKPNRALSPGDEIAITRGSTGKQLVVVKGVAETSLPKNQARKLYADVTPEPSPEERRLRDLIRLSAPERPESAPDKRDRRRLRRLKRGE